MVMAYGPFEGSLIFRQPSKVSLTITVVIECSMYRYFVTNSFVSFQEYNTDAKDM